MNNRHTCPAAELALAGDYRAADARYRALARGTVSNTELARIANDRGVLAAVAGREQVAARRFARALTLDPRCKSARQNQSRLNVPVIPPADDRRRIAVLSLLFNWPSTGGGTIHTKELCEFLTRDGYNVRHVYARAAHFGVGAVTERLPYDSVAIEFSEMSWQPRVIQDAFRDIVDKFDPQAVIITDSWNTKPLLAEAVEDYPYYVRIAALETLCPLNNVRLLVSSSGEVTQCDHTQLLDPRRCHACVGRHGGQSGGLHRAERALAGFDDPDYAERLRHTFVNAEGILVVNPTVADLVRPYNSRVHVLPSGFDPARFPGKVSDPPRRGKRKARILFAGLVDEFMKGFRVLEAAGEILWRQRQDFEIVATADPAGVINPFTRLLGWQSQADLPNAMSDADIIVFPTVAQEALGRSAVEAMASGRPVVASRIGGLPWVIEDGVTGLLFTPSNSAELASQLARLLDDAALCRRLGRAGRAKFEREFTWDVILSRYRALLGAPAIKSTRAATQEAQSR